MPVTYQQMENARRVMLQAKKELSDYMETPSDESRFKSLCDVVEVRTQEYLEALGDYVRQQYAKLAQDENKGEAA